MAAYLVPFGLSVIFNLASSFTAAYSKRWGARAGTVVTAVFRNVFGLPLLGLAFYEAAAADRTRYYHAQSYITDGAGWILLLLGTGLIAWSVWTLRLAAAAPSVHDTLVRTGPYRRLRHPLYSGVILELFGAALLRPTFPMLLVCFLSLIWVYLQARFEERDLLDRLPDYRAYMQQTGLFLPRSRSR